MNKHEENVAACDAKLFTLGPVVLRNRTIAQTNCDWTPARSIQIRAMIHMICMSRLGSLESSPRSSSSSAGPASVVAESCRGSRLHLKGGTQLRSFETRH